MRLANHRIYCFGSFNADFSVPLDGERSGLFLGSGVAADGDEGSFLRDTSGAVTDWIPPRLRPALRQRYAAAPIFERFESENGRDLHLPVHRLVSGRLPDRCRLYRLTQQARDLLNTGYLYSRSTPKDGRIGHRLALVLRESAIRRLGTDLDQPMAAPIARVFDPRTASHRPAVPVKVNEVLAYHFATGWVVVQIALSIEPLDDATMTIAALCETADHCSRFAEMGWIENSKEPHERPRLAEVPSFTLGTILAHMVSGAEGNVRRTSRTYTHCYAQVDPAGPATSRHDLIAQGQRLARQYTGDYDIAADASGFETVADFNNVAHVLTREGGATVVDPRIDGKPVQFLRDYAARSVEATYLPLSVLGQHRLNRLLEIGARSVLDTPDAEGMVRPVSDGPDLHRQLEGLADDWSSLRSALRVMKTRFRFQQVGPITMHNSFNEAVRRAFDLDLIEDRLARDLDEMSQSVQAAAALVAQSRRRAFERRFRFVPFLVTGAAAGIFCLEFLSNVSSLAEGGFQWWEIAGTGTSLLFFVGGAGWAYYQSRYQS